MNEARDDGREVDSAHHADDELDAMFLEAEDEGGRSVNVDEETGEVVLELPEDGSAALQEELDGLRKETADLRERLVRKAADLENARKRHAREREEQRKFAAESLLREMVPVLDDLQRAMDHAREGSEGASGALFDGVEMVERKFRQTLERLGCIGFDSVGERFDPNRHEALQQVEDTSVPNNTVLREFQKGYVLHDRLLRPALVVVSTGGGAAKAETPLADGGDSAQDGGS